MKPNLYSQPKQKAKLQMWTETPDTMYFEHDFGGYKLEARIVYNEAHDEPTVLSIHGALGDYTKSDPVSLGLRSRGHSVLSFSMSGHSPAGMLPPEQTTLGNNVREAQEFFKYLDPNKSKVIIGYSLGGTPALKTLGQHLDEVSSVVLFYPGIYDAGAYDKYFGDEFRTVISRLYSYRDNDTIEVLQKFQGKSLLICGEYDGLDPVKYGKPAGGSAGTVEIDGETYASPIPKEVIDMVRAAVPGDRSKYIEIPKCGHSVVGWMRQNPGQAEELLDQIDAFIQG